MYIFLFILFILSMFLINVEFKSDVKPNFGVNFVKKHSKKMIAASVVLISFSTLYYLGKKDFKKAQYAYEKIKRDILTDSDEKIKMPPTFEEFFKYMQEFNINDDDSFEEKDVEAAEEEVEAYIDGKFYPKAIEWRDIVAPGEKTEEGKNIYIKNLYGIDFGKIKAKYDIMFQFYQSLQNLKGIVGEFKGKSA